MRRLSFPRFPGHRIQGFNDIRDATEETLGLTLGLITGAVAAAAIAAYRRRARPAKDSARQAE